jgi:transcription elongation factor Elf1
MRKAYGLSKVEKCPFCNATALSVNKQGVPVCREHMKLDVNMKCACGQWLDIKKSKWGAFALCSKCGPMSIAKAMALNPLEKEPEKEIPDKNKSPPVKSSRDRPKEITVTSDDLDFIGYSYR